MCWLSQGVEHDVFFCAKQGLLVQARKLRRENPDDQMVGGSKVWGTTWRWVFPENRGKTPKMDGEHNGKPY